MAEQLIREIAAGRLVEGERLPPEREMAADLGISVGTLRKSLADLEARGLLDRRQGSGNYIKSAPEAAGLYALFRLELAEGGGGLPTAEILSVDLRDKPDGAPEFGAERRAYRIRRLRSVGNVVAAVEEIWLDAARVGDALPSDLSESLYLYYRDRLGLVITRAVDRVGIAALPEWTPASFGHAAGGLAGFIERVAHDQNDLPAEYSRTWFDAGKVRYVARLK